MSEELERVEQLLRDGAGMQLDAPGRSRLRRALGRLAGDGGDAAADLGPASPGLRTVAEQITVQETRFFRDPAPWRTIREGLLPAAIAATGRAPFVAWSAGAAHGQEAYSLAMLLEEAGCREYRIVASDLHRDAVARIAAGVYEERELRGLDDERRARWLEPTGDGRYRVRQALRARVHPVAHNIVTDPPPLAPGSCALILCRYTLIYLTPAAADRLLERIAGLLRADGRLVIGAAESLWHLSDRFAVVDRDGAFTYRPRPTVPEPGRRPVREPRPDAAPRRAATAERPSPARSRREPAAPRASASAPPPRASAPPAIAGALVAAGERAVAAGDLEAAARAFRGASYLRPDDPIAHLQLGLVLERQEDRGAERAFRAAWSALGRADPAALREALGDYRASELVHLLAAKLGTGA